VALNIDALHVVRALWLQPKMSLALAPSLDPAAALDSIASIGLPIGWPINSQDVGYLACTARVIGWIITALATLFGATFWFDALSGLVKLRGVGPSPDDKTPT